MMLCYVFFLLFIRFFHLLFFLLFIFLFSLFNFLPCACVIQQLSLPVSLSSFIHTTFPYNLILLFINLFSSVIVFKFCDIFISCSLLLFHFICLKFSSQLLPFNQYVPRSMPMFLLHTLITGI